MALKIVTGGTTGAADGTLVSSGNPLVIVTLNTAVDAHIRCDDGYWSNDQDFDVPAELEVSFDAGSTWYDNADEPITAPEIYAVNVPIKIRQTVAAGSTSGSFTTDGTYTAIAALSTPTLTATVVSSSQIDLSWTNVANENASPGYTLDRSTAADFSANLVTVTKDANVTTHSATGLTEGTHYYFRVRAEGSGRYSDSSYGTDDDTTTSPPTTATFGPSMDGSVSGYHTTNSWATVRAMSPGYSANSSSSDNVPMGLSRGGSADCSVIRAHLHFNTASLPDGATVVAARLKLWGHETYVKSGYHSSSEAVLLESLTSAGTALTTSDFPLSNVGSTEFASRKTYADWTDGAYNTFTLNASGLAAISKTGTTRLAILQATDFDNADPGAGTARCMQAYPSEYATSGKRPVLEVDYTV